MSDTEERKGWFGSTFNKLKSALSKTKTAIVGDDLDDDSVLENRASEIEADEIAPDALRQSSIAESLNAVSQQESLISETESSKDSDSGFGDLSKQEKDSRPELKASDPESSNLPIDDKATQVSDAFAEPSPSVAPVELDVAVGNEVISSPSPRDVAAKLDETSSVDSPYQAEFEIEPEPETSKFEFKPGQSISNVLKKETVKTTSVAVDEEYLESLEERLIKADIGLSNAESVIQHLRQASKGNNWNQANVVEFLKSEFLKILNAAPSAQLDFEPKVLNIYLVVGVNGTGKTTSIGKLCWRLKQEGKKVLMAAGDTFRAAAESQLEIWSKRAQVDIVRLDAGADPGAVVYKALEKAKAESYDCLVIDTAGRLHNKSNLMAELKKVRGVIDKHGSDCHLESLLVIDASTGQNGLQQAKLFTEVCSLTGVVLTKLDGTAKGGIVLSIAKDLDIPVKLIGLGEQIDDLRDFEPEMFVEALL